MEGFYNFLEMFGTKLPQIGLAAVSLIAVGLLIALVVKLWDLRRILRQDYVFLELTPPAFADKTARSTQQLFAVLHGLSNARSRSDKVLRRKTVFSLEVVSSREQGIRYIARVPAQEVDTFRQNLTSYLPDVKVEAAEDFLTGTVDNHRTKVIEFKQTGHYAFPLKGQDYLDQSDPIAYLTGSMTKLEPNELMIFQLVATPVKLRSADAIANKILTNEDLLPHLSRKRLPVWSNLAYTINNLLFGAADAVGEVYNGSTKESYKASQKEARDKLQVAKRLRPARTLSAFELELVESIHRKVSQPVFRTSVRAVVVMNNKKDAKQRAKAMKVSLASFSVPKYQALQARQHLTSWLAGYRWFSFQHRLPTLLDSNACVLAASEVSDIYHFPYAGTTQTENIIKSYSRTLPAPVSLKSGRKLAVTIGDNHHNGTMTPIGLTEAERERHLYIIGGTGNGKTTMLFYSILQDINEGNGIAVLDPHGDLAERILHYIPEHRIKDVIYMHPDDLTYPIGMNLLEVSDVTGDDLLREKDLITEAAISVLRKIFSDDDSGGHRIEYVLRNAIQTALTLENPTLFTIFHLLNDAKYRRSVVKNLEDKNLKDFWSNELGKAGEFQRVKMAAGITAKIGRFLFSASARRVLEQHKSTIDFEDILASRKVLICNFSKGMLGEDTSTLFGTTVLAKLQTAALRRARLSQADRTPFYLYVDEFQNFATMGFVQMLSEARKYKLFLTMAEQSTSQQDQQRLVDIILANVGTIVCFRSGSPADERLVLPLFSPFINQGEIANLPAYSYYVRIAAIEAQEPMSGMTVVVEDPGSPEVAKHVIESSRALYAKKVEAEQPMEQSPKPTKAKSPARKSGKNHLTKKANDELSASSAVR